MRGLAVGVRHALTVFALAPRQRLYAGTFCGRPAVVKERFAKRYRHAVLDARIRKEQMLHEARALLRCAQIGLRVPAVFNVDASERMRLTLERLTGVTVRNWLFSRAMENSPTSLSPATRALARAMGAALARLHDGGVIHGDLTTSNVFLLDAADDAQAGAPQIALIDFGLSSVSRSAEDRAVDLYVMERALISTHPECDLLLAAIMEVYLASAEAAAETLARLEAVRARGRKRDMFG